MHCLELSLALEGLQEGGMGGSCLSVTLPVQGLRTPHPCQAQVCTEGAGEGK